MYDFDATFAELHDLKGSRTTRMTSKHHEAGARRNPSGVIHHIGERLVAVLYNLWSVRRIHASTCRVQSFLENILITDYKRISIFEFLLKLNMTHKLNENFAGNG